MTTEMRYILRSRELLSDNGKVVTTREIAAEELLTVLAQTFGIRLPEDTRFSSGAAGG